jgi:hypothetical protein
VSWRVIARAALPAIPRRRRAGRYLTEGCWRFVVFPGALASRRVDVVFAVHLAGRGTPARVGMLDTGASFATSWNVPVQDPLQMSNRV